MRPPMLTDFLSFFSPSSFLSLFSLFPYFFCMFCSPLPPSERFPSLMSSTFLSPFPLSFPFSSRRFIFFLLLLFLPFLFSFPPMISRIKCLLFIFSCSILRFLLLPPSPTSHFLHACLHSSPLPPSLSLRAFPLSCFS